MIRVAVICDSALLRDGIHALLARSGEFEPVAAGAGFAEGLEKFGETVPDVVLMDVSARMLEAVDAAAAIRKHYRQTAIIMLCRHCGQRPCTGMAVQGYADLLLSKTLAGGEQLAQAIRQVHARRATGREVVAGSTRAESNERCSVAAWTSLSTREREVLRMVAEGKTSVEIGRAMKLSPKTVQTYRARMMSKLRVRRVPELIKYAVHFGVAPPG